MNTNLFFTKIAHSKKVAIGYKIPQDKTSQESFLVLAGSAVRSKGTPEFESNPKGYRPLRNQLIKIGIIKINKTCDEAVFTQNYIFSSSSAAASVVHGASKNGNVWKKLNA